MRLVIGGTDNILSWLAGSFALGALFGHWPGLVTALLGHI